MIAAAGIFGLDWPFVLMLGGFGLVVVLLSVWDRRLKKQKAAAGTLGSQAKPAEMKPGCAVAFGGLFFLAGLASLVWITLWPMVRSYAADRWPTTEGRVLTSRLESKSSNKGGTTYRIDIRYRYTVDGRTFESNQYDSSGTRMSSGGWRKERQAIVRDHRPGKTVTVHYNPADPADAMLSTSLPHGSVAFVWFPILFMGVGGLIMGTTIRAARRRGTPYKTLSAGEAAFDSRRGRRGKFLGLALFAVFWNGFVVVMFFTGAGWCMIPFALIGLAVAAATVSALIGLFNPTVSFAFDRMPLRVGDRVTGRYKIEGNYLAVRQLRIFLEGREQVSYRQGTNTRTETHVAYHVPVVDTTSTVDMESGKLAFDLPRDAMTSFRAPNNGFGWHLCVRGDIPGRPDIADDFDLVVLPAERKA